MRPRFLQLPQDRWWDLPAIFLIFVVLTITFSRLVATDWTQDLAITRNIAYLGLIAGVALGLSRFSPRWVFFFALIYGLFVIPWRVGLTLGEGIEWQERLISLAGRLQVIITHLVQRRAVPDNLLFLVLMAILFWILSTHAGYHLIRYANPWITILPLGIAIVLIHTYDAFYTNRIWYLVAYLFFALLLVARTVFLHNQARSDEIEDLYASIYRFGFHPYHHYHWGYADHARLGSPRLRPKYPHCATGVAAPETTLA